MAVTQGDVAQLAGVARRTVSNVVNDFHYVSDDVRRRVQEAIDQLGYQPNRAAQRLRTGRSGTIGVILPELDVGYFSEIGRLLVEEAESRGYNVLIAQSLGSLEREIQVLDSFASQQPDGLIFSPVRIAVDDLVEHTRRLPTVLLGEHLMGLEVEFDHVAIDNVGAAGAIVRHLIDVGRRRIAFVGDASGDPLEMVDLRLRGYREALAAAGIDLDPALVGAVDGYHRSQGYDAISRLLEAGTTFDAVFAATDLLALGAMRALADHGLTIPHDVAVAGFDDLDEGRFSIPRLTTVSPNKTRIAATALDLLVSRIEKGASANRHRCEEDYTIEVRESSVGREPAT